MPNRIPRTYRKKAVKGANAKKGQFKYKTKEEMEEQQSNVGPWLVAFILFVVVGSAVVQILNTIESTPLKTDDE